MVLDQYFWPLANRLTLIAGEGRSKIEFFTKISEAVFPYCQADLLRFCFLLGEKLQVVEIKDQDNVGRLARYQGCGSDGDDKPCFMKDDRLRDLPEKAGDISSWPVPYLFLHGDDPPVAGSDGLWPADEFSDEARALGAACLPDDGMSLLILPVFYDQSSSRMILMQLQSRKPFLSDDRVLYQLRNISRLVGLSLTIWNNSHQLARRVTDLECLNRISHLRGETDSSLNDIFLKAAGLIPSAWLYADEAVSRIVFDGRQYAIRGYPYGKESLRADILVEGKKRGFVEVCYIQDKPVLEDGPFLKDERDLLEIIATELSHLAAGRIQFEQMSAMKEQLQHANRLTITGQVAATVAHELNEPLTNIIGYAQLAVKAADLPPMVKQDLDRIVGLSLYTREIVRRLLMFSKKMPKSSQRLDLNAAVREALSFLEHHCLKKGLTLDFIPFHQPLHLSVDPNQIKQVVFNLVLNAVHASPSGGSIRVETTRKDFWAQLAVVDEGHGMSADLLEKIFIPFFSTKNPGEGAGLGLAVVKEIVDGYHGEIKVESAPALGARVTVGFNLYQH